MRTEVPANSNNAFEIFYAHDSGSVFWQRNFLESNLLPINRKFKTSPGPKHSSTNTNIVTLSLLVYKKPPRDVNIFFFPSVFLLSKSLERLRPAPWEMFYYLFGRMSEHNNELLDHLYYGIHASQLCMKYNAAYGYHTKQEKVRNEQFTKKFKKKIFTTLF